MTIDLAARGRSRRRDPVTPHRLGESLVGLLLALVLAGCAGTDPAPAPAAGPPTIPVGRWTELPAGPLSARHSMVGAWVAGRFVLVGGAETPLCPPNAGCLAPEKPPERSGAAFDPRTWTWQRIADAPVPIDFADIAVVGSRMYLLVGIGVEVEDRLLAYDADADSWSDLPAPPGPEPDIVAAGETLVAVSQAGPDHQALDPDRGVWRSLPADPLKSGSFRDPVWVGGRLLLAVGTEDPSRGRDAPAYVRLLALDASMRTWTRLPDTKTIGRQPLLVGGRLVWPDPTSSDGGEVNGWGQPYAQGGILDLDDGTWRALPKVPASGGPLRGSLVVGGRVEVAGHLLTPATRRWTEVAAPPGGQRDGELQMAGPELVLLWGGTSDYQANLSTGLVYRPGP